MFKNRPEEELSKLDLKDVVDYISLLMDSKQAVERLDEYFENEYDFLNDSYQGEYESFTDEFEHTKELFNDMEDTLAESKSIKLMAEEIQSFAMKINEIYKYVKNMNDNKY